MELDSSSLLPQSLSPSQSQRLGMQRLFLHLKRSEGQVCWSVGGNHTQDLPLVPPHPSNKTKTGTEKGWSLKLGIRISTNIFPLHLLLSSSWGGNRGVLATRPCPNHCQHIWRSPNATTQVGSRTAELGGLVAVVQAVVVAVAFPALLDAAVVLAGELPGLALRRGDVGRVGCQGESTGRILTR